jgi:hypothetical protein
MKSNCDELYFINDIKLLMTFHGSKFYFIKWISSMEIYQWISSSMEIYHSSLKFHPQKLVNGKFMYSSIENSQMIFNGCMNNFGMHGWITMG